MSISQLSTLVRPSDATGSPPHRALRRRHWSLLWPLGLLLGFAGLILALFGSRLLPARAVSVTTVVTVAESASDPRSTTAAATTDPFAGEVRFQASGWIEPDPLPIKATTLVNGVIDQVYVLEGDAIAQGQVIATLIDDDARLDLETARASRDAAQARLRANQAAIRSAQASIQTLEKRVLAAQALFEERLDIANRLSEAGPDNIARVEITGARLRATAQEAEIAALESERVELEGRLEERHSLEAQLNAQLALAETEIARRQLALDRTQIRSPIDGRVLRLLATPGQQRMLGPDDPDSAAIAYLYQPDRLQARIDVPLAEAAGLQVGQAVRVRTNFLPDQIFHGTVTRITGEADLQRNTLQAKVALKSPDGRLRPEMLCRAEFLDALTTTAGEPTKPSPTSNQTNGVRVYVPESALVDRTDTSAAVWRLDDSSEFVQRQSVRLGRERRGHFVRVLEGLRPGDRVVVEPPSDLENQTRVRPTDENGDHN